VERLDTELNTDFLEVWDGGRSLSNSQQILRLSGNQTGKPFLSSYNFVMVRYVSDQSQKETGFKVTWTTGNI